MMRMMAVCSTLLSGFPSLTMYLLSFQHGSDVRGVNAVKVDGAEEAVRVRHPRGRVQREPGEHDLEHALLAHVHG